MIREDEVRNIVGKMCEFFFYRLLGELDVVKEVKVKLEKWYVSVKIVLVKMGMVE